MSLTQSQIDTINSILATLQGAPGADGLQGNDGTNGRDGTSNVYSFRDDFGADSTGVNPCDAAIAKVLSSGVKRLYIPGVYRFNNPIPLTSQLELIGDGMLESKFQSYTTTGDGMVLAGPAAIYRLRDFTLEYKGAGQPAGKHGLRAIRKVYADSLQVKGFTTDGIYTDSVDGTAGGAAFYSRWDNVWAKGNGRDGMALRFGANGHSVTNSQFDRNRRKGFHHYTDGAATYNTTLTGSQACYNGEEGWYLENGTSIDARNLYAEYNGSPSNTNSDGYTNTKLDYFIGDNCSHSSVAIGAVLGNDVAKIRAPRLGLNDSVLVTYGGYRIFGSTAVKLPTS